MPAACDAASDFGLHVFVQQVMPGSPRLCACLTVAVGCFSDGLIAGLPKGSIAGIRDVEKETHSIALSQHAQAAAGHHRHLTRPSEASEAAQAKVQ